jgi:hypothetical protein
MAPLEIEYQGVLELLILAQAGADGAPSGTAASSCQRWAWV